MSIAFTIFGNDMSKPGSPVQFHFQKSCPLPYRRTLKNFVVSIFKKEKQRLQELNIIFCADEYLLTLNRQYLKHDFYTDILSFPLSSPGEPLRGEIYISIDRVRENAKTMGSFLTEELHRVIFHGILHFCGYKDKTLGDIRKMRILEDKYLNTYFNNKRIKA